MSTGFPWRTVAAVAAIVVLVVLVACGGESPTGTDAMALAPADAPLAKMEKVNVCHVRGNGDYHLININGNALDAHLAHGDAQPGDEYPTDEGDYVFGDDCQAECDDSGGAGPLSFSTSDNESGHEGGLLPDCGETVDQPF